MKIAAVSTGVGAIIARVHHVRAQMSGTGHLGQHHVDSEQEKLDRMKDTLLQRVRESMDTVADALREARIFGIRDLAAFQSRLERAKLVSFLTDNEIERRRAAVLAERGTGFNLKA